MRRDASQPRFARARARLAALMHRRGVEPLVRHAPFAAVKTSRACTMQVARSCLQAWSAGAWSGRRKPAEPSNQSPSSQSQPMEPHRRQRRDNARIDQGERDDTICRSQRSSFPLAIQWPGVGG